MESCPLCQSIQTAQFASIYRKFQGERRSFEYMECDECAMVFLHRKHLLNGEEERARYDTHENNPDDERYIDFLRPAFEITKPFLIVDSKLSVMDYGCGKGRPFSKIFPESWNALHYDPLYYPGAKSEAASLDWIVCTEAIEHFYSPTNELAWMNEHLKAGGLVTIMTGIFYDDIDFESWWYVNDPTHVCFFRESTFQWMAKKLEWELVKKDKNLVVFRK